MLMRLLIILGLVITVGATSTSFAVDPIPLPQFQRYYCPPLPSTFVVWAPNRILTTHENGIWWIAHPTEDFPAGSTVTLGPSDTYRYTRNYIGGGGLTCDVTLTIKGKSYEMSIEDMDGYHRDNCHSNQDGMTFDCIPVTGHP